MTPASSEAQRHLMEELAKAWKTTEGEFHFQTAPEHPVVRLARLVGDPTPREREDLACALANLTVREWRRQESGFCETYLARAGFLLNYFAEGALGIAP